jgi:hypothetical protein
MQKKNKRPERDEETEDQLQGPNRNAGKKIKGEKQEKTVHHGNTC